MFRSTISATLAAAFLMSGPVVQAQEETTPTAGMAGTASPAAAAAATKAALKEMAVTTGTLAPQDRTFVTKAAQGGIAEVKFGQLALRKSESADVKAFAQRMVTDHSKANDELKTLATSQGSTVPKGMDAQHRKLMKRLEGMSGEEFDKEYIKSQVQDHRKMIALFQKESESGQDPELKAFAAKTLPVLREHAKQARELAKEHGVKAGAQGEGKAEGQQARKNRAGNSSTTGSAAASDANQ